MFGPLNGVRSALVAGYLVAAVISVASGHGEVAALFLLGIMVHGLLWWKMYRAHKSVSDPTTSSESN